LKFPIYFHSKEEIIFSLYLYSIDLIDSLWISKNEEKSKKIGISISKDFETSNVKNNNNLIPNFYFQMIFLNDTQLDKFPLLNQISKEKSYFELNFSDRRFGVLLDKKTNFQVYNETEDELNDILDFQNSRLTSKGLNILFIHPIGFVKTYPFFSTSLEYIFDDFLFPIVDFHQISIIKVKIVNGELFKIYSNFNNKQHQQEVRLFDSLTLDIDPKQQLFKKYLHMQHGNELHSHISLFIEIQNRICIHERMEN
jgi:hypothetical protein